VDIKRIIEDIELQVRKDGIDMDIVRDYTSGLEDPMDDLPPLAVFTEATEWNENAELVLADGFHRIEAYRVMKRNLVPVSVFRGNRQNAIIFAIEANAKHGKPLTREDREFNIQRLLSSPATKNWSVRKIAEVVGVSKSTVQNIKNPPTPKPTKTKSTTKNVVEDKPQPPVTDQRETREPEKFEPGIEIPFTPPETQAATPVVVRERAESTLPTNNEKFLQLRSWVLDGSITRSDIMNLFASDDGHLVWVKRQKNAAKRMLIICHGRDVLIEAEVSVDAESSGMLSVSVENPRLVEYQVDAGDPFSASATS
jgi:hypothetical protein